MIGSRQNSTSPYVQEANSNHYERPSHTKIENYAPSQTRSKFIRDIEEKEKNKKNSAKKTNHLVISQTSKQELSEHSDHVQDALRLSFK